MERIAVVFDGSFQGIYRTIPVDYPGPNGTNYRLFLKVESVTDGDGNALKYESHREGAYRKLKITFPALRTRRRPSSLLTQSRTRRASSTITTSSTGT